MPISIYTINAYMLSLLNTIYNIIDNQKNTISIALQKQPKSQIIKMSSNICYLLPKKWWMQFCHLNKIDSQVPKNTVDTQTHTNSNDGSNVIRQQGNMEKIEQKLMDIQNSLVGVGPQLQKYTDSMLLDFQQQIHTELQHKINYIKIHKIIACPQILSTCQWIPVSNKIWNIISAKFKCKFGIMRLWPETKAGNQNQLNLSLNLNQNLNTETQCFSYGQKQMQAQIVFCSKKRCQAFVGFLPENTDIAYAIRNIGYQLGFIQMNNSRISFPDKNAQKPYYFCQFQTIQLADAEDSLFLAYNMQCTDEKQKQGKIESSKKNNEKEDFSFGEYNELGNSNEAVAGDMAVLANSSMQQMRNNGTVSTGAETPSFFASEDEYNSGFRVRQLFRQRKPQQIQQLRVKAIKSINGKLIPIYSKTEKQIEEEFQYVRKELWEHINVHKKKGSKDKQLYNQ